MLCTIRLGSRSSIICAARRWVSFNARSAWAMKRMPASEVISPPSKRARISLFLRKGNAKSDGEVGIGSTFLELWFCHLSFRQSVLLLLSSCIIRVSEGRYAPEFLGKYVIVEVNADIVRLIFRLFVYEGWNYNMICDYLNDV